MKRTTWKDIVTSYKKMTIVQKGIATILCLILLPVIVLYVSYIRIRVIILMMRGWYVTYRHRKFRRLVKTHLVALSMHPGRPPRFTALINECFKEMFKNWTNNPVKY